MTVFAHGLLFALRLAFGAWFVFAGLNDLLHFWTPPAPSTPQSQIFMTGLAGSGFVFPVLGVVYLACGLAVLCNRYVALALVVLAAPTVVIVGYHAVMERHLLSPGLVLLAVHLLLAWQQRATLAALLRPQPLLAPVRRIG
ncbi:DoxX family membrane protein [Frateuria defendens]|uniref:DoxX family membrane protein n=1 Tax=Frateuria defendens TaxID=2219559 RepID=UPI00066FF9A9|nr:DoxX family membrane protein [Frateuria defendens]